MESYQAGIRTLVNEIAPRKRELRAATRLVEDLGFDSVLLLELAVALEERFDLPSLEDVGMRGIRTIGDLETLVGRILLAR